MSRETSEARRIADEVAEIAQSMPPAGLTDLVLDEFAYAAPSSAPTYDDDDFGEHAFLNGWSMYDPGAGYLT